MPMRNTAKCKKETERVKAQDGGGGRQEVTASPGRSQEIIIDPSVVMLGNSFPSGHNRSFLGRCLLS